MKKPPVVMMSAVLLAMLVAAGCKKEQAAPPPDPRAAARNTYSLLYDGTREQYMARLDGTVAELNAAGAMFDFIRANMDFRNAFIHAYGKSAWDEFGTGSSDPASEKQMLADEIDKSEPRIDGDQATLTCKKPGAAEPSALRLVQFNGGWKVKASCLVPSGENGDKTVAIMPQLTALIAKYRRAIGKPGVRPEDITYELRRESDEMFGKKHEEPHRFDINKLQN